MHGRITISPSTFAGILAMIMIRTLRRDIANYNKEDDLVHVSYYVLSYFSSLLAGSIRLCQPIFNRIKD